MKTLKNSPASPGNPVSAWDSSIPRIDANLKLEDTITFFGSLALALTGLIAAAKITETVLANSLLGAIVFASAFLALIVGVGKILVGETARRTPIAAAVGGSMMGAVGASLSIGAGQWLIVIIPFAIVGAVTAHYLLTPQR